MSDRPRPRRRPTTPPAPPRAVASVRVIAPDLATAEAVIAHLSGLPGVALAAPRLGRKGEFLSYGTVAAPGGQTPEG